MYLLIYEVSQKKCPIMSMIHLSKIDTFWDTLYTNSDVLPLSHFAPALKCLPSYIFNFKANAKGNESQAH